MCEKTCKYHKHNFLKFQIMHAAKWKCEKSFTSKDIEAATGIPYGKVNSALAHWKKLNCGYFRALKKRVPGSRLIRWKITKKGMRIYEMLLIRVKLDEPLNLTTKESRKLEKSIKEGDLYNYDRSHDIRPERMMQYIGITRQGYDILNGINV